MHLSWPNLFPLCWAQVATILPQTLHPRTVSNVLNTPNRFPLTKTPAGHLLITAFSPTSFKKQTKKFPPPLAGLPEHTQIRLHQTQPGFLFNKKFTNPQATNYPFRRLWDSSVRIPDCIVKSFGLPSNDRKYYDRLRPKCRNVCSSWLNWFE